MGAGRIQGRLAASRYIASNMISSVPWRRRSGSGSTPRLGCHSDMKLDPKTGGSSPVMPGPDHQFTNVALPVARDPEPTGTLQLARDDGPIAVCKPRWDGRRLYVGNRLIKEYKVPASTLNPGFYKRLKTPGGPSGFQTL